MHELHESAAHERSGGRAQPGLRLESKMGGERSTWQLHREPFDRSVATDDEGCRPGLVEERNIAHSKRDRPVVLNQCGPARHCNDGGVVVDAIGPGMALCTAHSAVIETTVGRGEAEDALGSNPTAEGVRLVALQVTLEAHRREGGPPPLDIQRWRAGMVFARMHRRSASTDVYPNDAER